LVTEEKDRTFCNLLVLLSDQQLPSIPQHLVGLKFVELQKVVDGNDKHRKPHLNGGIT